MALKFQDVIVTSKDQMVTRASRAHIAKRAKVILPANTNAEQATDLLAARNISARIVSWGQATQKQRDAAAAAKASK